MKKFVAILSAVMMMILAIVPMASAGAVEETNDAIMYVYSSNGLGVRMRQEPSTDAKVLFNLGEGRPVTVVAVNDGWYEVQAMINGKTYNGYIMSKFLSNTDPALLKQTFTAVDKQFAVKIRTARADGQISLWDTTSKLLVHRIRILTKAEKLTVIAASHAWYQVVDANGNMGFVAKAYVENA